MRTLIFPSLLATALLIVGCGGQQTAKIEDVTRPTTLTLTARPGQGNVHRINVRIVGRIDGTAQISGPPLPTRRVSGSFELKHSGDHYGTNLVLHYAPVGVRSGRVRVDYEFYSKK